MTMTNLFTIILLLAGCFFFLGGTLGLLRFPDLFSRLHALTKVDNIGLGLIAAGMAIHIGSPWAALKIFLIWLSTLLASSTACYLVAKFQLGRPSESPEVPAK